MPIIKSAKKRVRLTRKATARNAQTKKALRGAVKTLNKTTTAKNLAEAFSALDKAVKKGLMHKNKVARKKRQLAAAAKAAGVKLAKSEKPKAQSASGGKPAAKKPAAKKPAAKKTPAKKPAAKAAKK